MINKLRPARFYNSTRCDFARMGRLISKLADCLLFKQLSGNLSSTRNRKCLEGPIYLKIESLEIRQFLSNPSQAPVAAPPQPITELAIHLDAAQMTGRSTLGFNITIRAPLGFNPTGTTLTYKVIDQGIAAQQTIDISSKIKPGKSITLIGIPSEKIHRTNPAYSFDLANPDGNPAHALPRFTATTSLDVSVTLTPGNPQISAAMDERSDVTIPLPVVFIHGYGGPLIPHFVTASIVGFQVDTIISTFRSFLEKSKLKSFFTPYSESGYRTFERLNTDLLGTVDVEQAKLSAEIAKLISRSYANDVDILTHSTGGLVARRYLATAANSSAPNAFVHELVMVACPNRGTNLVYKESSSFSKTKVDQLVQTTVAGYLIPRTGLFPANDGNVLLKDGSTITPESSTFEQYANIPTPAGVSVFNIYGVAAKNETPGNLIATPKTSSHWYKFSTQNKVAGDGTVSAASAFYDPDPNANEQVRISSRDFLGVDTTHIDIFSNKNIQNSVLLAFGL